MIALAAAVLLAACVPTPQSAATPTLIAAQANSGSGTAAGGLAANGLPATWTPLPEATAVDSAGAPFLTWTPGPTPTPWPTFTPTPIRPTATVVRSATAVVAPPSATSPPPAATSTILPPVVGDNLLPNPSFEGGWYHINGIPELQVADQWQLSWDTGDNPLDPDPWNDYVRPEARVLSTDFLPPAEHDLFIWDGTQTVKIFKGQGAISFRLVTDLFLEPGTYRLVVNVFPDLVVGYRESGAKIWAPDPLSGEVRFIAGDAGSGWIFPVFGRKNTLDYTFVVTEARTFTVGLAMRGRWAIENNGWFLDDWSLKRVSGG